MVDAPKIEVTQLDDKMEKQFKKAMALVRISPEAQKTATESLANIAAKLPDSEFKKQMVARIGAAKNDSAQSLFNADGSFKDDVKAVLPKMMSGSVGDSGFTYNGFVVMGTGTADKFTIKSIIPEAKIPTDDIAFALAAVDGTSIAALLASAKLNPNPQAINLNSPGLLDAELQKMSVASEAPAAPAKPEEPPKASGPMGPFKPDVKVLTAEERENALAKILKGAPTDNKAKADIAVKLKQADQAVEVTDANGKKFIAFGSVEENQFKISAQIRADELDKPAALDKVKIPAKAGKGLTVEMSEDMELTAASDVSAFVGEVDDIDASGVDAPAPGGPDASSTDGAPAAQPTVGKKTALPAKKGLMDKLTGTGGIMGGLLGALLGFFVGGPIGAILGLLLGGLGGSMLTGNSPFDDSRTLSVKAGEKQQVRAPEGGESPELVMKMDGVNNTQITLKGHADESGKNFIVTESVITPRVKTPGAQIVRAKYDGASAPEISIPIDGSGYIDNNALYAKINQSIPPVVAEAKAGDAPATESATAIAAQKGAKPSVGLAAAAEQPITYAANASDTTLYNVRPQDMNLTVRLGSEDPDFIDPKTGETKYKPGEMVSVLIKSAQGDSMAVVVGEMNKAKTFVVKAYGPVNDSASQPRPLAKDVYFALQDGKLPLTDIMKTMRARLEPVPVTLDPFARGLPVSNGTEDTLQPSSIRNTISGGAKPVGAKPVSIAMLVGTDPNKQPIMLFGATERDKTTGEEKQVYNFNVNGSKGGVVFNKIYIKSTKQFVTLEKPFHLTLAQLEDGKNLAAVLTQKPELQSAFVDMAATYYKDGTTIAMQEPSYDNLMPIAGIPTKQPQAAGLPKVG